MKVLGVKSDYHRHDLDDRTRESIRSHLPRQSGQWGVGLAPKNGQWVVAGLRAIFGTLAGVKVVLPHQPGNAMASAKAFEDAGDAQGIVGFAAALKDIADALAP